MNPLSTKITKHDVLFSKEDLIAYEKHSFGAFELHTNYIVIYKNWLPFRNFTKGRIMTVINLNNVAEFCSKGPGWFMGLLGFGYKSFIRREKFRIFVWWVWRRKRFNENMKPIFEYLNSYFLPAWMSEKYRVVESSQDLVKKDICPKCGEHIAKDQAFCSSCGYKIK